MCFCGFSLFCFDGLFTNLCPQLWIIIFKFNQQQLLFVFLTEMPRLVIAKWFRKRFPTTEIGKLIPQMPYEIPAKPIQVRGGRNLEHLRRLFPQQERLRTIAKSVTKLIDEERIELNYFRGYETRNYTERLIAEAMRYGDCHKPTMELADFYLNDKTLIHKLFKVLVPRYLNYTTSFTSMHLLPQMTIDWSDPIQRSSVGQKVIVELKGNPYPSLFPDRLNKQNLLHNILLSEASKEFYREKAKKSENLADQPVEQTTKQEEVVD